MLGKFPQDVKVVVKHFPLTNIHPFAQKAALAAVAAQEQGKFWEFHDLLFKAGGQINDQKIRQTAQDAGLDLAAFDQSLKDSKTAGAVERDLKDGFDAGVRGTPAIFVNGRLLASRSIEGFEQAIERELKKAGQGSGEK